MPAHCVPPDNSASNRVIVAQKAQAAQARSPVPAAAEAPKINMLNTKKFYIAAAALFAANIALLAAFGYLISRIDEYHDRKNRTLVAWGIWLGVFALGISGALVDWLHGWYLRQPGSVGSVEEGGA
ncbi:hypothetical protein LTR97_007333 [Elasticomyces elasticus]|uniref:Uncharacterized protein n=1 Tax=Elasticomyces elasticus TaxID=574655 RepID=A0AAN7VQV1_9PEZI|nr:hypothetical protein LTR97_007333 [Elasticomyces elasticus]